MGTRHGVREASDWISSGEAAKLLGVSTTTVRALIRSGRLRAWRLDTRGHWRIERLCVELVRSNQMTRRHGIS